MVKGLQLEIGVERFSNGGGLMLKCSNQWKVGTEGFSAYGGIECERFPTDRRLTVKYFPLILGEIAKGIEVMEGWWWKLTTLGK